MSTIREIVLKELYGRLWHTTHPDRFKRIVEMGAILPIPENPNPDGWGTPPFNVRDRWLYGLVGVGFRPGTEHDAEGK